MSNTEQYIKVKVYPSKYLHYLDNVKHSNSETALCQDMSLLVSFWRTFHQTTHILRCTYILGTKK